MSAESGDNTGPVSVPEQDVDANQNKRLNSSKAEVKSGIITEGESKSRQKSGQSRLSSGEYSVVYIHTPYVLCHGFLHLFNLNSQNI